MKYVLRNNLDALFEAKLLRRILTMNTLKKIKPFLRNFMNVDMFSNSISLVVETYLLWGLSNA